MNMMTKCDLTQKSASKSVRKCILYDDFKIDQNEYVKHLGHTLRLYTEHISGRRSVYSDEYNSLAMLGSWYS